MSNGIMYVSEVWTGSREDREWFIAMSYIVTAMECINSGDWFGELFAFEANRKLHVHLAGLGFSEGSD
jgi:hypothetical protein